MGKAILFVRVSTLKQELQSQLDVVEKMAKEQGFKKDDTLTIKYKESATNPDNDKRLGLHDLYSTIETRKDVVAIFVTELSRLSRRKVVLGEIEEYLVRNKIQLYCDSPKFTLLDEKGEENEYASIVFSLFACFAQQEMVEKKERFERGKERKAAENKYNGGRIPYGYRIDREKDNLIIPDDEKKEIVQEIYNLYEKGMSQTKIAEEITMSKERITVYMVNNILKNEHYTGKKIVPEYKKGGSRYPRAYPQIISEKQFQRCRDIAKSNSTSLGKCRNIYFAEHLVRCPDCGSWWAANSSNVAYRCYEAYQGNKAYKYNNKDKEKCTNKTSLSINVLDSLLWYIAKNEEALSIIKAKEEDKRELTDKIESLKSKMPQYEACIEKIRTKMEKAKEVYIEDEDSNYEKYREKIYNLKAEKFKYETEIHNINTQISLLQKEINNISVNISRRKSVEEWQSNNYKMMKLLADEIENDSNDITKKEIIQRQIFNVKVEKMTIYYEFGIGWRKTQSKLIHVRTRRVQEHGIRFVGDGDGFVFIPFNGKGGQMLGLGIDDRMCNKKTYIKDENGNTISAKIIDYTYLNRFQEKKKIERRKKEKQEKYKQVEGMLSVRQVQELSGYSYGKVCFDIREGKLKAIQVGKKYFISKNDAEVYKSKDY